MWFSSSTQGHSVSSSLKNKALSKIFNNFTEALRTRKVQRNVKGCEGKCPMIMQLNLRRTIATVTQGKPKVLQAPDSDVSLHIPEGSKGLFTMRVHTDDTRFPGVIPDDECIVSPLVEVEHKTLSEEVKGKEPLLYAIKMPHSLRYTTGCETVRVRRVEKFDSKVSIYEVEESRKEGDSYKIDQKFITIYTRQFSIFVCTSCGNTCQAAVMLFLFGKLEPRQEADDTLTKIKSFICSNLYCIKDFREVSENSKIFNLN